MLYYLNSIHNRYLMRHFFSWVFSITCVALSCVFIFEIIEMLRRSTIVQSIRLRKICEMALLKFPSHLSELLPFICFLSVIISFWRLNHTHELVAFRAIGISIWQIVHSICFSCCILGASYLFILDPVRSALTQRLAHIEETVFKSHALFKISLSNAGLWFREPVDNQINILYAKSYHREHDYFTHVVIHHFDDEGNYNGRTQAQSAQLQGKKWLLKDVQYTNSEDETQSYAQKEILTNLSVEKIKDSQSNPDYLSFLQLYERSKVLRSFGLSTYEIKMRMHTILAKTFLLFALTIMALNFCLHPLRFKSILLNLFTGITLCFMIHFFIDLTFALGMAQRIPIILAAWIIPLVTLFLSLVFLIHVEDKI